MIHAGRYGRITLVSWFASQICADCGCRLRPALAGKWLAAMPAQEALSETEQMTAASVSAALSSMKPEQAAQLVQVGYSSLSCFGSLLAHCGSQPNESRPMYLCSVEHCAGLATLHSGKRAQSGVKPFQLLVLCICTVYM